jgi:hypothetical protein
MCRCDTQFILLILYAHYMPYYSHIICILYPYYMRT